MGFKEPYPDFPYGNINPPPADIAAIATKVLYKRYSEAIVSERIAASPDDSCKLQNGYNNAATELACGHWDSKDNHSAMRFTGITIPAGATITTAYIKFTARWSRSGQSILSNIFGEKTQAPIAYGATEDFTTRARTTAFAAWDGSLSWTAETVYNSPGLKTIIQELVDAYGAYSDGVIALQWLDDGTGGDYNIQFAYAYDNDPSKAPVLYIEYEVTNILTNQYLFQYQHRPATDLGYLYVALLSGNNPEGIFSINDYETRGIEFSRLGSDKLEVYYDSVLKFTFPHAALLNTLYDGYYVLLPVT